MNEDEKSAREEVGFYESKEDKAFIDRGVLWVSGFLCW